MEQTKLERMLVLVGEHFDTRNDPTQLDVDEAIVARLLNIHPATVVEFNEGDGPIMWLIVFPVSKSAMDGFLNGALNETQLFESAEQDKDYSCLYLCSVVMLEEYRGKGIAFDHTINSIKAIGGSFKIDSLFVWPFEDAGLSLAQKIANEAGLPLYVKQR